MRAGGKNRGRGRGKESRADVDSLQSAKPDVGPDPTTPRP